MPQPEVIDLLRAAAPRLSCSTVRRLARSLHFFWLPCPVCGRHFAGFESTGSLMETYGKGWSTCPRCPGNWIYGPDGIPVQGEIPMPAETRAAIDAFLRAHDWRLADAAA